MRQRRFPRCLAGVPSGAIAGLLIRLESKKRGDSLSIVIATVLALGFLATLLLYFGQQK